jgi:hypothetical protein
MNNQELQELSKKVAEKFGINPYTYMGVWIHEDLKRVIKLAIKYDLNISFNGSYVSIEHYEDSHGVMLNKSKALEEISDYESKERAVIVAVLKALLEIRV